MTALHCTVLYCIVLHLEEDTEREGEGDGDEEPGHGEQHPAARADTLTRHLVALVWMVTTLSILI